MDEIRQNPPDDEIDLRDIIAVIWNNRVIIVLGTIFATLLGAGVNFILPDVYRASMVISPGVLEIDETTKEKKYIASAENLMVAIQLGTFDSGIEKMLSQDGVMVNVPDISFTVVNSGDTILIKVSTDQTGKEQTTKILIALLQLLRDEYRHKSDHYKAIFQREIEQIRDRIKQNEMDIPRLEDYINRSDARIEELSEDLRTMIRHGQRLSEETAILRSKGKNKSEELNNNIFRLTTNLARIDDLKASIYRRQTSRSDEIARLHKIETDIVDQKHELIQKQAAIDNVQDIELVQAPVVNPIPVKPRKARNIAVAFLAGLFLSIIFVFLKTSLQSVRQSNKRGA